MYSMLILYMYLLRNDFHKKLVKTSVTSHSYHLYVCKEVRTFKMYPLSNFQVHRTVLLTVVTVRHIRSQNLSSNRKLVRFDQHLPIPPPLTLATPSLLSVSVSSGFFRFHICDIVQYLSFSV